MFKKLFAKKETNFDVDGLYSPINGIVKKMSEVDDPTFSQYMMGDGFAVVPNNDKKVKSPVCGRVKSIFPTKHAITLMSENGQAVLVHMGIDTIDLQGKGFNIKVSENQKVVPGDVLAEIDFNYLESEGKCTDVMVVCLETEKGTVNVDLGSHESVDFLGKIQI